MRKASESSDVNLREGLHGKMYVIDQLLIETMEMFLNESGMSEVCLLRVAESTLIRPRNVTTNLRFRLRGPEQLRRGDWDERRVARYRRAAAKLNYLALDNPCIAYASKDVSRKMSDPEPSDEKSIIRFLRDLKQSGMIEYLYKWHDSPNEILVYTDSEWAGCQRTRRSNTGGAVMYGSCLVAHWSRTQVSVALSSAEAELHAAVKAACEAIGML